MLITLAFTVSGGVAMAINALFLVVIIGRERRRRAEPQVLSDRRAGVSTAFISIWVAIVLEDLMMVGAGLGLLVGMREFGYLLAAMPLVSVLVGLFALRWLR